MGQNHGLLPSFMAKPHIDLDGNGGHMHVSLVDKSTDRNAFIPDGSEPDPEWPSLKHLSITGRYFLAGLLDGLVDLTVLFLPTINSYRRLSDGQSEPKTTWGLENRNARIRLITPPTTSRENTRVEIRLPGADACAPYVLAAIFALGLRGIQKRLKIKIPPLGTGVDDEALSGKTIPCSLEKAITQFIRPDSIAREILGDHFVNHYGASREHELKLWHVQVTEW
jgi:glutamine synthetase